MTPHRIDGARVGSIDELYEQFNDLFMTHETWRLAPSLDALNDILYGIGTVQEPAVVEWIDAEQSRRALGVPATRKWLEDKLARPDRFNSDAIRGQLDALLDGTGPTYFDLVLEVFGGHADHIELRLR